MANYEIHIQDVENIADPLVLHYAERDAIELNWLGGDSKTQPIVGSELNFSLEAGDARDAAFIELFTLDEKRWLVTFRVSDTQELIWQGYVLPESYEEPYRSAIFYVQISAVDGLGLLRGVKLPDSFYNAEKTVMQVLCAILKLTRVDLELFFSPAIINTNEPDWNKLLVDTLLFDKKKDNAYQLLKDLMESMRCQVYQCEGRWYIEGFNKKQLLQTSYEVYDLEGNFLRQQSVEKLIKQIPFLAQPTVRMVPGIREAVVTYERNPMEFPEDMIQENEVPWVVYPGQIDNLWLAKNWNYREERLAVYPPERYVVYRTFDLTVLDTSRFVTTRDKYFVRKNSTVKIKMGIKVYLVDDIPEGVLTDAMIATWPSRQIYEVRLDGKVIITNQDANKINPAYLDFNNNGTAEVELFIRPEKDGLLDLKFYEPLGDFVTTRYRGTEFQELSIEVVPEIEDEVYVIENTQLGSNVSELNIRFGDDPTLFSNAFYLERTRKLNTATPNRFWFAVFFYEQKDGKTYAIVPLRAAVLAHRLRFETSKIFHVNSATGITGQILDKPEIIFNYEDGESSAILVNESLATGHILINYPDYVEETRSRLDGTQWSDAIRQVERKRYGQVVGEIEKRVYETPHFSFEASTDAPLKFNDIIKRRYYNEFRFFTLSQCSWRGDSNTSEFVMNEMLYEGASSEILPPFVDAGPDIILNEFDNVTFLSAVASAPSGTIETIVWEKVAGTDLVTIGSPGSLQTEVDNVDADFYTFRITVTDSNGLSAFDEVNVIRVEQATLVVNELERTTDFDIEFGLFESEYRKYEILVNPALENNVSVAIIFDVFLSLYSNNYQNIRANADIQIFKNSIQVYRYQITDSDMNADNLQEISSDVSISLSNQDSIIVELFSDAESFQQSNNEQISSTSRITFKEAVYTGANIEITNLPIVERIDTNVST